ncbi:aminotransferase class I/II-fold pyridoxal phosphate-dependent enzyme [Candidatus Vidania fulgoroideorum]
MKELQLNKMEFPWGFCKHIKTNLYPKQNLITKLKKLIKKFLKIKEKIILGNGSDELIFFIISCYKKTNYKYISSFYPSFYMYEFYSKSCNIPFIRIKLNRNFSFKNKLYKFINKNCGIFFIAYPNNPTGNIFKRQKVLKLIKKCKKTLFVIDEAYFFFSKKTITIKTGNHIILRTFSKIGFAGLRLGILICINKNYKYFKKKKSPYNINSFTIFFFIKFFKNKKKIEFIKRKIKQLTAQRNYMYKSLKKKLYKSYGNFFLVKSKYYFLKKKIKTKNIITKKIIINGKKFFRFSLWKKANNKKIIKYLK